MKSEKVELSGQVSFDEHTDVIAEVIRHDHTMDDAAYSDMDMRWNSLSLTFTNSNMNSAINIGNIDPTTLRELAGMFRLLADQLEVANSKA